MTQTQESKREKQARAQARCRSRRKSQRIAQENELKAKQEMLGHLTMELAEHNRQNKETERRILKIRDMTAYQRSEIEASQREGDDMKIKIFNLRWQHKSGMVSSSSS